MCAVAHEVVVQEPGEYPGVAQFITSNPQNTQKVEFVGRNLLGLAPDFDGVRMASQERLELVAFLLGLRRLGQRGAPVGVKEAFEDAPEELGSGACPRPATR